MPIVVFPEVIRDFGIRIGTDLSSCGTGFSSRGTGFSARGTGILSRGTEFPSRGMGFPSRGTGYGIVNFPEIGTVSIQEKMYVLYKELRVCGHTNTISSNNIMK